MNAELAALAAEDRAGARDVRGAEAFLASQGRRARVAAWLAAGAVQTPGDYYHAACVFQHGEALEHWAQAHLLARVAAEAGVPGARFLAAAAYDRWLMRQGQPQHYGTQTVPDGAGGARLWDLDPATPDAERATWDVPPLAELEARAAVAPAGVEPPGFILAGEIDGSRIVVLEREPPPPLGGAFPVYGFPAYVPLAAGDPRPAALPPPCTGWRFGPAFVAKDAAGTVVCTWHPCRWHRAGDPVSAPPLAGLHARLGAAPLWLTPPEAYWQRLGVATAPGLGWLVGGTLPRADVLRLAAGLP